MTNVRSLLSAASYAWLFGLLGCDGSTRRQTHVEPVSSRAYTLVAPRDHDPRRPARVLFSLHAFGNEPETLVEILGLVRRAVQQRGWLLVIPSGERDSRGAPHWNASAACCGFGPRHDDVAYLRAVLADVRKRYAVDAGKVSAIGLSNGGFMAQRWACEPGGDLRMIVSIAGAAPGPDDPPCRPSDAVSVLHIHGDRDVTIDYHGGTSDAAVVGQRGRYPSAAQTVALWLRADAASQGDAAAVPLRKSRERTLRLATLRREDFSPRGRSVSLWTVEGEDHGLRSLRWLADDIFEFMDRGLPR